MDRLDCDLGQAVSLGVSKLQIMPAPASKHLCCPLVGCHRRVAEKTNIMFLADDHHGSQL